jgi:hypothetical protein
MKKEIKLTILLLFLMATNLYPQGNQSVEMADVLRESGKIYTVVFGLVVILTGMIVFLIRVDGKISKLEKNIEK